MLKDIMAWAALMARNNPRPSQVGQYCLDDIAGQQAVAEPVLADEGGADLAKVWQYSPRLLSLLGRAAAL